MTETDITRRQVIGGLQRRAERGSGSSAEPDSAVAAALASVKVVGLASGRRQVRVKLRPSETITVAARVSRGGRRIALRRATLSAEDSEDNSKLFLRSLHVPRRRPG